MDNKPKKRGRKPKNSTKSKDYNQIQTDQNDNLIINLKDLSEETNEILPGYVPEESIKNMDGSSSKPFFNFNRKPEISKQDAIELLIKAKFLKDYISPSKRDEILKQNIINGKIEGVPLEKLVTEKERIRTYNLLVKSNKTVPLKTTEEINDIINKIDKTK